MKKRVIFAGLIALLLLVYTVYEVFFDDDSDNQLRTYGKKLADDAYKDLETRVGAELERLFHELDENGDGCLQLEEFKDRRLAIAAAVSSARRNFRENVEALPRISLTTRQQVFSFFFAWFQFQCLFLLAFVVYENAAYIVSPEPRVLRLDNDYVEAEPEKVNADKALKYDTPMTFYERAKMAFFILSGIAFLRIVLTVFFLLLGVLFLNLAVAGGRNRVNNPTWFGFFEQAVQFCGSMILISLGFYCPRVYGQVAELDQTKLLLGNHICAIETILLFFQGRMPAFVSRIENLSIMGFKAVAQATNSILVNRDAQKSKRQTMDAISERAKSHDPSANRLMLFPEGTCSAAAGSVALKSGQSTGSGLFMFKKGAFEPGEPVQLVAFAFPYQFFNCAWTGRAAGGNDFFDLALRLVCQFVNHAEMRFLPVYYPTAEEKADAVVYAAHAQKMIAHVVRQPVSDATYANYKQLEVAYSKRKHEKKRYTFVDGEEHEKEEHGDAKTEEHETLTAAAAASTASHPKRE